MTQIEWLIFSGDEDRARKAVQALVKAVRAGRDLEEACLWLNQGGSREEWANAVAAFGDAFEELGDL